MSKLAVILLVLFAFLLLYFLKVIRFTDGVCPNCKAKLPSPRIPRNFRQAMWGGWTCKQCGCESDAHGDRAKTAKG